MTVLLAIMSALYALMMFVLWRGWRSTPLSKAVSLSHGPLISVVIPVRNEAQNLPYLLADLSRQSYARFEVIVADDSSTDDTVAVVRQLADALPYTLHVLPLPDERTGAPKKRAIAQSIRIAQGDLILTTDGDCRVGPDWILSYASYYTQHQPKMMTGPVTFTDISAKDDRSRTGVTKTNRAKELSSLQSTAPQDGRSEAGVIAADDVSERSSLKPPHSSSLTTLFAKLQTVEFSSLIGSGAATLALNAPTMCNGANLCYEKRVFEEVNGFTGIDHVASGDDELLMHKIARRFPSKVQFLKNPGAIVETAPHASWRAFYNQRKRWASKWRAYDSWQPSALAIFVFLSNMAPVVAVLVGVAGILDWSMVLLVIGLKVVPEFLFLRTVLRFLGKKWAVWWIPATQIVYPFYVLFFGLAAQRKGFTWKGRELK